MEEKLTRAPEIFEPFPDAKFEPFPDAKFEPFPSIEWLPFPNTMTIKLSLINEKKRLKRA